jgi:hypothetical protein
VGWIKTVGEWIGKRPADVPTAAAQKEKFEAKEVLREAERKDAHRGLCLPSEKEKCWMNSFGAFRIKVDTLLAINNTRARAELFLLLNAALNLVGGQNKQFAKHGPS